MTHTVTGLYRYPVKGLSGEELPSVALAAGTCFPLDRAYALAHGSTDFNPAAPAFLPKTSFLMLARNPKLAALETRLDNDHVLTVLRDGRQVARGSLDQPVGRKLIEQFFAAFLAGEVRGAPKLVHADDHEFSDTGDNLVSVINLASVRDLERVAGATVDPMRFRGNIYVDGGPAWSEFAWVDKDITVGGVRLRVLDRTGRCPATNVDPKTGVSDMNLPRTLQRAYGHADMGVYAQVIEAGEIAHGDTVSVS